VRTGMNSIQTPALTIIKASGQPYIGKNEPYSAIYQSMNSSQSIYSETSKT